MCVSFGGGGNYSSVQLFLVWVPSIHEGLRPSFHELGSLLHLASGADSSSTSGKGTETLASVTPEP